MGSVGLWVGLGPGSKFSLWYGWVEQIGPTDNSDVSHLHLLTKVVYLLDCHMSD